MHPCFCQQGPYVSAMFSFIQVQGPPPLFFRRNLKHQDNNRIKEMNDEFNWFLYLTTLLSKHKYTAQLRSHAWWCYGPNGTTSELRSIGTACHKSRKTNLQFSHESNKRSREGSPKKKLHCEGRWWDRAIPALASPPAVEPLLPGVAALGGDGGGGGGITQVPKVEFACTS